MARVLGLAGPAGGDFPRGKIIRPQNKGVKLLKPHLNPTPYSIWPMLGSGFGLVVSLPLATIVALKSQKGGIRDARRLALLGRAQTNRSTRARVFVRRARRCVSGVRSLARRKHGSDVARGRVAASTVFHGHAHPMCRPRVAPRRCGPLTSISQKCSSCAGSAYRCLQLCRGAE
eukprot:scaffold625_cov420-Prasinococcus_capsulatus_cf.AAC.60